MSEAWAARALWCPACQGHMTAATAGRPSLDLFCERCGIEFELKAKKMARSGRPVASLTGGAYEATFRRFGEDGGGPHLILMEYEEDSYVVRRVTLYHSFFLTPSVVVPREPLGPHARRAGWQGCNIRLKDVPAEGSFAWVDEGIGANPSELARAWSMMQTLRERTPRAFRGWTVDVLRVVDRLPEQFVLADVYAAEDELAALHPGNFNVRAKVRQQLQVLRNAGHISFEGRGRYTKNARPGVGMPPDHIGGARKLND